MARVWELIHELAAFEKLPIDGSLERLEMDVDRAFWCYVYEAPQTPICPGEIVAYSIVFPTYSTFRTRSSMWLEDLYVTPSHRGSGIGKEMLSFLISEARRLEYGRLEWSVLDWNQDAVDFYERMGAAILPDWKICRIAL
jgi:GNAT superfamily N-acetyltransferase